MLTAADLPSRFLAQARHDPAFARWVAGLPRLARDLLGEWRLTPDGRLSSGAAGVVLPVRDPDGTAAALKLGWPHPEAEHEHLALQAWGGRAAVRLLRADPRRSALLLERADADRDLHAVPVLDACAVAGGLYAALHRPALPQLRTLSSLTAGWVDLLEGLVHRTDVPRRFVTEALSYARAFVDDPGTDGRLLHTDLHYANVLASFRAPTEPWLVIDPKPVSGDPAFEVAPLLWNRWDEVQAAPKARDALLDRFYAVVDTAGLEEPRARAWVIVRALVNVGHEVARPVPGQQWISVCTTLVKALPT